MAQATNTQLGEIQLAGDLAGNGGPQVGTNPQLKTMPGLTPGSYTIPTITVDAKGRVTAIASGGAGLVDLLPHASATRSGIVSVGDNLYIAGEPAPGFWTIDFGGTLTGGTATGLSNQACAQYSFDLVVDAGAVQKVTINGSNAQTVTALITALNAVLVGATAGLIDGNIVIASNTEGKDSKIVISNVGLFGCITGFVSVGSATAGNGSCELYAKRGSNTDYGVVKIGAGIDVTDGVISFDISQVPIASNTEAGIVKVPVAGNMKIDGDGNLSVPVATTSVRGVVKVGSGLAVTGEGVLSVDPAAIAIPTATTSAKGIVQIGSGLDVADGVVSVPNASGSVKGIVQVGDGLNVVDGVVSVPNASGSVKGIVQVGSGLTVDGSGTVSVTLPTATTGIKGMVQVGSGLSVDGNGVISTTLPVATTSTKGIVQVGSGLSVDGAGVLSIALADGSTSTKGIVQIGTNINVTDGVISVNTATTGQRGVVQVGAGLAINGSGVLSVPVATTSVAGVVRVGSGLAVDGSGIVSVPAATTSSLGVVQVGNGLAVSGGLISVPEANGTTAGIVKVNSSSGMTISNGTISLVSTIARTNTNNIWTALQVSQIKTLTTPTSDAPSVVIPNTGNVFFFAVEAGLASVALSGSGVAGARATIIAEVGTGTTGFTWPAGWTINNYVAPSGSLFKRCVFDGVWLDSSTFVGGYRLNT